jgi:endonuclease I
MAVHFNPLLDTLEKNLHRLKDNHLLYYNEKKDRKEIIRYYRPVKLETSKIKFQPLHALVERTHINRLPYTESKDQYLYTWVDLQPDGDIKSIYSGKEENPADLIARDYEVRKKHERLLAGNGFPPAMPAELKFNAEHIVPQSWFGGREPMKGDLHHLFACEPGCNAIRSNYAYHDFPDYNPELPTEKIRNHCGVASSGLFEPEFGKGAIARAFFYFVLRYPKGIKKTFRNKVDFSLLRRWNREFPPDLYEKHRNQAIFHIQGNRNPFIDFPELAEKLYFPLRW